MSQKQNVKEEKKKKCLYGFEKRETSLALDKTWKDYYNLSKEQVLDRKIISHHKRVIRKLQNKLRKPITPFIMFEVFALWFYKLNAELFKEDVNNDLIEKAMIKTIAIVESGMPLDKQPNIVEDRIRSYHEWRKYVAEVSAIRI